MADEFDVLDLVTAAVESAATGLVVCQGNSADGEKREHIVVNSLPFTYLEQVGSIHVNVNLFTYPFADGLPDIERQKEVKRKVSKSLQHISHPAGLYFQTALLWSSRVPDAKEGFDCINIRIEVITEKN